MKCPRLSHRVIPFLLLALVISLIPSRGHAQRVLESRGINFRGPSIIEVRSTSRDVELQEVLTRATATAGYGRYRTTVNAVETSYVCGTPCRFELQRPMELQVDGRSLHLVPDGAVQRYLIEPKNGAGHAFGVLGISFGVVSIASGALLLGLDNLPIGEGADFDTYGPLAIGVGGALLVLGIVAVVVSRGRIQRVDRFEF